MSTLDEVRGKLSKLQQARQDPNVVYWLEVLEDLGKTQLVQSYNLTGEEAVRAMGVQKGINMALMLDKIYESTVNSQIVKPGILKP